MTRLKSIRLEMPWFVFCLACVLTLASTFTGCAYLGIEAAKSIFGEFGL